RATPAHDLNFIARAGVLDLLGPSGDWAIPLNLVADFGGAAMHTAFGIMAALYDRQQTGVGQYLDISYLEATVALAAGTPNFRGLTTDAVLTGRGKGVLSGAYPYYTVYRTRDGKGLTVACSEQRLWDNFCRALGLTDLACHGRHPDHYRRAPDAKERAARERIAEHIGTRDLSDWLRHLQDADTCVAPVNDATGLLDDPQLRHRGLFVDTEHPSEGRVRHIGSPIRLSNAQVGPRRAAPLPGEHTDAVLADLGLSSADIMRLRAVGVVN
ncbi:MAG: CoA transferase, partial [Hyphomicrobiales bacterium]